MSNKVNIVLVVFVSLSLACASTPTEIKEPASSLVSSTVEADPTPAPTSVQTTSPSQVMETTAPPIETVQESNILDGPAAYPGYTLFAPIQSNTSYLIDMDGAVVHTWESTYQPGQAVYLLENGSLLRTANVRNPTIDAGGAGGLVQEISWDGTVLWEFAYSSDQYRLHHDVEPLPNGNALVIAWDVLPAAEALAAGRDPSLLNEGEVWSEHIFEISPDGIGGAEIVWEWYARDHLVQDHDRSLENYGSPEEHPELIDLNFTSRIANADWLHINSIDYNPQLDQIVLSVHNFNEIWIIDHSTTSAQAANHNGGNSDMGGDLLYRWGNPSAYSTGTKRDMQLSGQHDAQWIEPGSPGEGNILIFNNMAGGPQGKFSAIVEITPPLQPDGSYTLDPGAAFAPQAPVWIYTAEVPTDFFSQNISGVQRLPNANTLICSGAPGLFIEVTPAGEIVWEYENKFGAANNTAKGKQPFAVFKIRRYPLDYPGFNSLE